MSKNSLSSLVFLSLILSAGFSHAVAVKPNYYYCKGNGIDLIYNVYDDDNTISFTKSRKTQTFQRSDIDSSSSIMGELLSVVQISAPDSFTNYITLILPNIALQNQAAPYPFETTLVFTKSHHPMGHPGFPVRGPDFHGSRNPSTFTKVTCEASAYR